MYLIRTIKGDITKVTDVQAIVNAANYKKDMAEMRCSFFHIVSRCTPHVPASSM